MVASGIVRSLKAKCFTNIVTRTHAELDFTNQQAVKKFLKLRKKCLN
jgi:GDP-L-fucose synthase